MSPWLTFRRVVLPQATRVIIPPTGNELINLLKGTSLVSVLAISDLLYAVQTIYSQNFQTIPLLITATIWYLAITTVLNLIQSRIERHYAAGTVGRGGRVAPGRKREKSEAAS
jgi:polar amino acid transport system permease protein